MRQSSLVLYKIEKDKIKLYVSLVIGYIFHKADDIVLKSRCFFGGVKRVFTDDVYTSLPNSKRIHLPK